MDGVHIDQNSPAAGWRSPFFLAGFGGAGGCKRFNLTYRTSESRSKDSKTNLTISFTLQKSASINGPWTDIVAISRSGWIQRNAGASGVDFDTCSAGGSQARTGAVTAAGTGD